jgi:transcriptional regulator with XRE-family HTH domain
VVLPREAVEAEVARLCQELAEARRARGLSIRSVAESAGINHGTVWRIENGRSRPTLLRFLRFVLAVGLLVDLDDGADRPMVPMSRWRPNRDYLRRLGVVDVPADDGRSWYSADPGSVRSRLGCELWWARHNDLADPLDAAGMCFLLEMSHHTLEEVEFGFNMWPSLASVVRVAGVTGRRLVLNDSSEGWRSPPWD